MPNSLELCDRVDFDTSLFPLESTLFSSISRNKKKLKTFANAKRCFYNVNVDFSYVNVDYYNQESGFSFETRRLPKASNHRYIDVRGATDENSPQDYPRERPWKSDSVNSSGSFHSGQWSSGLKSKANGNSLFMCSM